ncbi:MAG TPA: NAD-dependent succinate-semialdehyde dehydrogenase [Caulobacteraceae bacterium]|nr:NAD-dependent succinate-semialdehyde dehydrogenase [Caulobacteraceae bacterium]
MIEAKDFSGAYVGGRWVDAKTTFDVTNPATGAVIAKVADLDAGGITAAIDAAVAAMPAWAAKTAHERAAVLHKWAGLLMQHQEDLAQLMTAEQGKPLTESRGEVAYGASFITWFAEEAKRAYGEVIPTMVAGKRYLTLRQPSGVAAAITPWNFPIAMLARKVGPALAVGCAMVAKPAEETPLCALAMARLADEAGVPAGVFNVVTTMDAAGAGRVLCEHPKVRVLSFTGSTEVGKILYRQSAGTMKKLALELGGNAPVLVFDDADLDRAVAASMASKFRNAGQTCVCANRLYVQAGIYDAFLERFTAAARALKVGPGAEAGVEIGPLINADAMAKVVRLVGDATAKGAKIELGGHADARGGQFYAPTVLSAVTAEMQVSREEIFGPVAPVVRFETEEEGIALANAASVGLAAYVFTRDLSRTIRVSEALEVGIVAVNDGVPAVAAAPFGGVKESGIGREGGRQGLDEYMDTKYVCIGL